MIYFSTRFLHHTVLHTHAIDCFYEKGDERNTVAVLNVIRSTKKECNPTCFWSGSFSDVLLFKIYKFHFVISNGSNDDQQRERERMKNVPKNPSSHNSSLRKYLRLHSNQKKKKKISGVK